MQKVVDIMKKRALQLLEQGTVNRVLGWKNGDFTYDQTPAVFNSKEEVNELVYNDFSAANLSKYLIAETKKEGKILAFLKPCDTYSFNQLIKEHRINRENVYVIGVECQGKVDVEKVRALGAKGVTGVEVDGETVTAHTLYGDKTFTKESVLMEKCLACKGKTHMAYDELIIVNPVEDKKNDRFKQVEELENMTPDERFAFWQGQLSKCIRCNACRNVCPACSCLKCVFDNPNSGVASKAVPDTFEEQLFHVIRAFHVAGRCTDCGECSRVCPQNIPLHLLNRKFIKDINKFYGEYQAGADTETRAPLTNFTKEDVEPSVISDKGGKA
ncbi:MAG: 4Fe-4S dicluster domain-containing protein [Christensenellaceae bacterium]|nr:4Fe-4S dicluster domain-containing protein [Christensenellaceae bacterium]MDD6926901.1 4Fe-4S dicluster domain-containing protein [bacterium]MDY2851183.1 4Fe-4S dicluster domain-containing protein [Christensenellaceae bacterium]